MKPWRSALHGMLETERFRLKPLNSWQAFRVSYPWTKDAELIQSLTQSSKPRTARKWYREMTRPDNRKRFCYAIVPKSDETCIGMHMLHLDGYRSAQLSVVVHDRAWWGRDVVLEVRRRLIDHFIAARSVERFWSTVASRNLASVFNYQKLGFQHVGTLHRAKADPVTGEVFDFVIFELLGDDWQRLNKADRLGD